MSSTKTGFIAYSFALGILLGGTASAPGQSVQEGPAVDFAREIRPILSDHCFACHGPDDQDRKAKFRLDTKEGAFAALRRGGRAIVPGKPAESQLLERITEESPSRRMPPPTHNKDLKPQQIELLKRWIAQGAPWSEHWAFVPPRRPALPPVKNQAWSRTPIDRFILARLEKAGLAPSPEADPVTLIRRLTFDLTGLPPTPAQVDAFLADKSPDAYERLVERLLASPHYGERLALDWLDAARFADTHGYHIDAGRDMSRWREWVIDAFNEDLPFDRFTIEQTAGDLLPNATLRQRIASGFHRNHMINFEGGAIPAEYHNAYIVDRVNTLGTVWLGLTVACAQCHDHKYDPISQREFYRLYAFFHNVPENGLDGSRGNAAPLLKAPTKKQEAALAALAKEKADIERRLEADDPALDAQQKTWEKTALSEGTVAWTIVKELTPSAQGGATFKVQPGDSLLVAGPNPSQDVYTLQWMAEEPITGLRLEALPHASFAGNGPGRSVNGNVVLTDVAVRAGSGAKTEPHRIVAGAADFSQKDFPLAAAFDADPSSGWAIHPEVGKRHEAVFVLDRPIAQGEQATLTLAFRSKYGQHSLGHFRLAATSSPRPAGKAVLPDAVVRILRVPAEKRTPAHAAALRKHFRETAAPATAGLRRRLEDIGKEIAAIEKSIPTVMVMQEMARPRDTFVLTRGDYDKKGEKVTAGVPAFLPPLPKKEIADRLDLARWLVAPEQPLTSRVTVNRYWQMFFGHGLVRTPEDFGSQGEPPTHPELLDWLAVEFQQPTVAAGGKQAAAPWSVKHLVRLLVTSATYRQSSKATPAMLAGDPENRLLGRAPRFRLQAEFIRDQALAVSGLLDRRIGGKSVSPYQPPGLWAELSQRGDSKNWSAQFFELSKGPDLYRRSMYTFWKRTSPPPQMVAFDAPDREVCTVRRARTNTPLQALILMNDPTYVEAARKLAERLLKEADGEEARIELAFRLTLARKPSAAETRILRQVFARNLQRYRADTKQALQLLEVGASERDAALPVPDLAAWTMVGNVLLNLDETLTRN